MQVNFDTGWMLGINYSIYILYFVFRLQNPKNLFNGWRSSYYIFTCHESKCKKLEKVSAQLIAIGPAILVSLGFFVAISFAKRL